MTIPNTARTKQLSYVPGNISHDGPTRALSAVLKSGSAANNVFGRAFTFESTAKETVQAGGAAPAVFAGIMINPKNYMIDNAYAANGTVAEFVHMGEVAVEIAGSSPKIGDPVYFVPGTGVLTTTSTNNRLIVGAFIVRHMPSTSGALLAVISLTGYQATVA